MSRTQAKASPKGGTPGRGSPAPKKAPATPPAYKLPDDFVVEAVKERPRDVPTAFLNSADFQGLGLSLAGTCEVCPVGAGAGSSVFIDVWPSDAVSGGTVQLDAISRHCGGFALKDSVVVRRFTGSIVDADRVSLVPRSELGFSLSLTLRGYLQQALVGRVVQVNGAVSLSLLGEMRAFNVVANKEHTASPLRITARTVIDFGDSTSTTTASLLPQQVQIAPSGVTLGGLQNELTALRDVLDQAFNRVDKYRAMGLTPPRGVLLYGPPGTGKTLLARKLASETGATLFVINGGELVSKFYGETEAQLRDVFRNAAAKAPSIVFLDEIDAIAGKRDESFTETDKRIVATLLTVMDGLDAAPRVAVIGATNRPDALDAALRRPGRFDREIEIPVPSAAARCDILQALLAALPLSIEPQQMRDAADIMHGYVGADLAAVVQEAALSAMRRLPIGDSAALPNLTVEDLRVGLTRVRPSVMRGVEVEVPRVSWEDIGGQDEIKARLREAVEWPVKHPDAFLRMGIRPPRGLLLYGPPGCSKTMLAKALATDGGLNFIAVKGPELFSKWVGDSEKAVRELFRKARLAAPSIVFFDEIDAIAVQRGASAESSGVSDRVLAQLLAELDGVEVLQAITVVAATNRPDLIDKALLRPGRIDRAMYVAPPDASSRAAILRIQLRCMAVAADVDDAFVGTLVQKTNGFSGAEIAAACREAALQAMQEDRDIAAVAARHFNSAVARTTPRITPAMLEFYANYQAKSR